MDVRRRAELFQLHANLCQALADPTRLYILEELRNGVMSVSALVAALGTTQSNVSRHLAVLRERGVVRAERDGMSVHYALEDPRVLEAIDLLRGVLRDRLVRQSGLALVEHPFGLPVAAAGAEVR